MDITPTSSPSVTMCPGSAVTRSRWRSVTRSPVRSVTRCQSRSVIIIIIMIIIIQCQVCHPSVENKCSAAPAKRCLDIPVIHQRRECQSVPR